MSKTNFEGHVKHLKNNSTDDEILPLLSLHNFFELWNYFLEFLLETTVSLFQETISIFSC